MCESFCVTFSYVQTDATTPNIVGPTMLLPVSNFAQQIPVTMLEVVSQQCCVRFHGWAFDLSICLSFSSLYCQTLKLIVSFQHKNKNK